MWHPFYDHVQQWGPYKYFVNRRGAVTFLPGEPPPGIKTKIFDYVRRRHRGLPRALDYHFLEALAAAMAEHPDLFAPIIAYLSDHRPPAP